MIPFSLPLAGMQKLTALDFPGVVSAVLFTQGCNFSCPYCHNPHLIPARGVGLLQPSDVTAFLEKRIGLLDGIVISGGEPTLHDGLAGLCRYLRSLGYKVKLDTNGSNPPLIAHLLEERLVDYIAMDLKTAPSKYSLVSDDSSLPEAIQKSVTLVRDSRRFGAEHEFRTTCVESFVSGNFAHTAAALVEDSPWYLQKANVTAGMESQGLKALDAQARDALLKAAKRYGANPALR